MTKETFIKAQNLLNQIQKENSILDHLRLFRERALVTKQTYQLYDNGSQSIAINRDSAIKVAEIEVSLQEEKIKALEAEFYAI